MGKVGTTMDGAGTEAESTELGEVKVATASLPECSEEVPAELRSRGGGAGGEPEKMRWRDRKGID